MNGGRYARRARAGKRRETRARASELSPLPQARAQENGKGK